MAPFDRSCTTFYWSAIVYIALSGTVLAVEKNRDIEIWARGQVIQTGTIRKLG